MVEKLLAGEDAIVARPTGGGKSLCFQLPALIDALRRSEAAVDGSGGPPRGHKTAVVIVPSVSLMVDQVSQLNIRLGRIMGDDLTALGIAPGAKVAALLGTGQPDPTVNQAAMAGEYRLLYITERLIFGASSNWLKTLQELHRAERLLFLAVDEAHVVRQCTLPASPCPCRRHLPAHLPSCAPHDCR